jgi:hypothetical protein
MPDEKPGEAEALPTFRALFLFTRACGIADALRDGETPEQIARSYSMDPMQVQLIGMTPLKLERYHAREIERLLAALTPEQREEALKPFVISANAVVLTMLRHLREDDWTSADVREAGTIAAVKHAATLIDGLRASLETVTKERDELRTKLTDAKEDLRDAERTRGDMSWEEALGGDEEQ